MKTTADFLDDLRTHFGLLSDNKLALKMAWDRQQLRRYRNQKHTFDDRTAIKVAEALGIEPDHVLACMAAQRAIPESKSAWERIAAKVAACFLFGIALTTSSSPAPASPDGKLHNPFRGAIQAGGDPNTHRRQRRRRRACGWRERAAQALSALARYVSPTPKPADQGAL